MYAVCDVLYSLCRFDQHTLTLLDTVLDPSAAEFRRRHQPAPCCAAATGKNLARRHASRNLLKPPPPQFLRCAEAQVILTNYDTCSSFIIKLSNSTFGRKKCCNVVKPPAHLHVKSVVINADVQ